MGWWRYAKRKELIVFNDFMQVLNAFKVLSDTTQNLFNVGDEDLATLNLNIM